MDIANGVALGTGGASGLGLAPTQALVAAGAGVVILDLPSSGARVRRKARRGRPVRDQDAVTAALDAAAAMGPLRVAVCCAGTGAALRALRLLGRTAFTPWKRSPGSSRSI